MAAAPKQLTTAASIPGRNVDWNQTDWHKAESRSIRRPPGRWYPYRAFNLLLASIQHSVHKPTNNYSLTSSNSICTQLAAFIKSTTITFLNQRIFNQLYGQDWRRRTEASGRSKPRAYAARRFLSPERVPPFRTVRRCVPGVACLWSWPGT